MSIVVAKMGFFGNDNRGNENELFKQFIPEGEEIVYSFKGIRDELVFTNKRLICNGQAFL